MALVGPGCLHVRVAEHRITLTEEGGGEARLILADIRSDGIIDSLVVEEFQKMMLAYEGRGSKISSTRGGW